MSYRLRYTFNVDWVGPGMGPIGSPQTGVGGGNAQTLGGINQAGGQNSPGLGASGVINGTDITNMTNAMAADVAAQLNLSPNLLEMQGWPQGKP
jgi:hypothetical protein